MPFESFLTSSLRECTRSQEDTALHEAYILFLFTHILRELLSHLTIQDDSPFHHTLSHTQTQLLLQLDTTTATIHINFHFQKPLPNTSTWAPLSSPARNRTWITWPDVLGPQKPMTTKVVPA